MSRDDWQLSYEISPIILVGGIAGTGMLPIVLILDSANYPDGVVRAPGDPERLQIANSFGHFRVLSGGTLMDNEVATYPLANQTVAANAVITNPLKVSLEMVVPANDRVPLQARRALMTSLKSTLDSHTAMGGWYNVATPSYIYQGCLLVALVDASEEGDGTQPQERWVWNFEQPLLTTEAAQAAQNQAMAKISNQTQNAGDPPGSQPIKTGISQPSSNIVQNTVPAAATPQGSNVAPTSQAGASPAVSSVSPVLPAGS